MYPRVYLGFLNLCNGESETEGNAVIAVNAVNVFVVNVHGTRNVARGARPDIFYREVACLARA